MSEFDKAIHLWDEEELEQAIPLFERLLKQGEFKAAYYLGINSANEGNYLDAFKYLNIYKSHGYEDDDEILEYISYGIIKFAKNCSIDDFNDVLWTFRLLKKLSNHIDENLKKNGIKALDYFLYRLSNNYFFEKHNKEIESSLLGELEKSKNLDSCRDFLMSYYSYLCKEKIKTFSDIKDFDNIYALCKKSGSGALKRQLYGLMGDSYRFGKNNAPLDIDMALNYYDRINDSFFYIIYNETLLIKIDYYLKEKKYKEALAATERLKDYEFGKKSQIVKFAEGMIAYEEERYLDSIEAIFILYYGKEITRDITKAVEYAHVVYWNTKNDRVFNLLCEYYRRYDKTNQNYRKLLIQGAYSRNDFSYGSLEDYRCFISTNNTSYKPDNGSNSNTRTRFERYNEKKYAINNYLNVDLREENIRNYDQNYIYYYSDYYSVKTLEENPYNKAYRDCHDTLISVKNGYYFRRREIYPKTTNFPKRISDVLNELTGSWIICFAPGHSDTRTNNNGVINIINNVRLNYYFDVYRDLILKKYESEKKVGNTNRSLNFENDLETIKINNEYDIKGKNFIIFDDITTSGATLIACRVLLKNAGANNVLLMALGKTKSV